MVGADGRPPAPVRELVFGRRSSSEEDADVNKEFVGQKMMESSTTTSPGTDGAALTAPSSLRGGQANEEELGKKLVPSSPPPHRNYSQERGSEQQDEDEEKKKKLKPETTVRHHTAQQQRARHPSSPANSGPAAMETDYEDDEEKSPADALRGLDMETTTAETEEDEAYQSGKEVPRCNSENLDSSPDYGRREVLQQGNSRHICKYCAKEFSSGRALGGHMRAHGSLTVEEGPAWTTNADGVGKHQLMGAASMGHASQHFFNNTDSGGGSDHVLSNSVKQHEGGVGGGPLFPYSKRSRNNGKEIQSGRSGGRRSKHVSDRRREISPKNSDEVDDIKQLLEEEEENAAAPMTEPEPSISSDDDGATNEDGVTDGGGGASNVCNVCDREFENGKQLNSHKKSHGLYALRRNPKRSRRFIDQDYTAEAAAASSAVPAKKTSSMFTPDGNMHACTECGKRFQSWKALFGHMRCHPERNWRGIQRPDAAKDKQEGASSGEQRQLTSSRRREAVAPPNAASQESDSESEAEALGAAAEQHSGHGKAAAAAASDNESDTESIEAAYMNGERQPSTSTWIWMTGKRSKRSRQTVRSLQAVTKTAAAPVVTPAAENEMEHETAMGLMMLARKEGGKENWLEGRRSCEMELGHEEEIHENASSETDGDELDEQLDNENAGDSDEDELAQTDNRVQNSKGKGKLDAADNASLCEENEEGADDCEAGEQGGAGSAKPKYVCNTCKRVFKSHQALGGHRASHKKVKGCFARTNVSDGVQENPDDETMSEEFPRSDDQLPTELQDPSQSEGDEKERQFSAFSKDDSGEVMTGSRSKSKGHVCTICGRVFNSGQALGGHKRRHYNTKEGTSSEATSSTNNTNKQQPGAAAALHHHGSGGQGKILKDELVQHAGPARSEDPMQVQQQGRSGSEEFIQPAAAQVRPVKEKFLDLNLPAPVNDDDMELEAYDMPPADLMCVPLPAKKIELKGTVDFPSAMGIVKSSNFDAELETVKPKEEYFPLYHTAKYASLVEENNQDLGGGQDTGFRGGEVDFSLRYVRCNICDRQFNTVEALGNHEKTHSCMMSSVSGLTPISA